MMCHGMSWDQDINKNTGMLIYFLRQLFGQSLSQLTHTKKVTTAEVMMRSFIILKKCSPFWLEHNMKLIQPDIVQ